MYYWRMVLTGLIALYGGTTAAQETPAPAPTEAADESPAVTAAPTPEAGAETATPDEAAAPVAGDVITMKDGKVITGVQVVRATPSIIAIQIVPDVEPLELPRKMVESIAYDNLRPEDVKLGMADGSGEAAGGGQGEISLELATNLGKSVTDTPLPLADRDVVEVLEEFARKLDVELEILPEVRQMQPARRLWNTTIPAGMAFTTLLREKLPADFPMLEAVFTFERVQLQRKPAEGAAPPPPPPAPGIPTAPPQP
jgi:hypothetical protein